MMALAYETRAVMIISPMTMFLLAIDLLKFIIIMSFWDLEAYLAEE